MEEEGDCKDGGGHMYMKRGFIKSKMSPHTSQSSQSSQGPHLMFCIDMFCIDMIILCDRHCSRDG